MVLVRALPVVLAGIVALLGCEGAKSASTEVAGCGKDTDCKGDRICESGRCTAPASPNATLAIAPPTSTGTTTSTTPSLAKMRVGSEPDDVSVAEEGVELCSSTPCDILYKGFDADPATEHSLTFARKGYRSQTRIVKVADSPISVKLVASR